MEHRRPGPGDLELPVITFGAWAIGGLFWGGSDDDEAIRAIHAALDHGMDAVDTAPIYGCGHSEILVGRAIRGRRDHVKILTKCGLRWDSTEGTFFFRFPAPDGGTVTAHVNVAADSIRHECEQSLARLAIEAIDLYQVHWPGANAPPDETMAELMRLRDEGKIRHIGVSNYNRDQLAGMRRCGPVVSNQIKYNLLHREIEADPLPFCRENGIGVIAYSPMALGLLTGRVGMGRAFPDTDVRSRDRWYAPKNRQRVLNALDQIRPIAETHGATLAQLAVAWVIAQPGITTALVGARNAAQVAENAAAANVRSRPDELSTIRAVFEALGSPLD